MYSKMTSNEKEYNDKNNYVLEKCIKNIALGSKDDLKILYELTKSSVYGFSLSILKNIHEAEDILQDVYIKIYDNANTYQENGKPMAWILTITKNLSLMKLRKNKNNIDLDEIIEFIPSNYNNNDVNNKLLLETLFKAISDEERNIIILHSVSGYKHREISKLLNLPLSTVLSKYNRALKKLKKIISEEGNL